MVARHLLHIAAKLIRADGTEGFESAAKLVGHDIALGMLIVYLHGSHNPQGGWPDKLDTPSEVEKILIQEKIIP